MKREREMKRKRDMNQEKWEQEEWEETSPQAVKRSKAEEKHVLIFLLSRLIDPVCCGRERHH